MSGEIPPELGRLTKLEGLDLGGNDLSGDVPPELGSLTNLKGLHLSRNRLTGRIPSELGRLSRLEALILGWNELTGQIPSELGHLANLTRVVLEGNWFTGCVPLKLRLVDLTELGLPLCSRDRAALVAFYYAMDGANWSNNWLSSAPIGDWHGVTAEARGRVTELTLGDNGLSGEILPELGSLSELTELRLYGNR